MKTHRPILIGIPAFVLCLFAVPVLAHVGDGTPHVHGSGFASGLLHPFTGLDHLAAMVAVGLWAALMGGRMMFALPLSFAGAVVLGGLMAFGGVPVPFVEPAIAASLFVLGMALAAAVRPPLAVGVALVAVFALFHGYAHGAEMAAGLNAGLYGLGFTLATLLLHLAGLGLGLAARCLPLAPSRPDLAFRLGGAVVLAAGLVVVLWGSEGVANVARTFGL